VPQGVQGARRLDRPLLGGEQRQGHIALGAKAGTRLRQVPRSPRAGPANRRRNSQGVDGSHL
jgi:hypothetical protein